MILLLRAWEWATYFHWSSAILVDLVDSTSHWSGTVSLTDQWQGRVALG